MTDPLLYPKLRFPIDLRIEKIEEQEILVVACPIGISQSPLLLVSAVAPIVASFEGSLSVDQIIQKFSAYGITKELVNELVKILDDNLFLASPKFDGAKKASIEQFKLSPVRPAALAGLGYPRDEEGLKQLVDGYLSAEIGLVVPPKGELLGVVSPHIDYRRGGISYGVTYQHLRNSTADTAILIGTSHQYSPTMFQLTAKDFDTPLGVLPCNTRFVQKLAAKYGVDRSFADEVMHRREHSLELQTPFMKRVRGEKLSIVPILVGSFHQMLIDGRFPNEYPQYQDFIGALTEASRDTINEGGKLCVVAGVDMAHIGRQFGDKEPLTPELMTKIASRDQIYIDAIVNQDKRRLFTHIAEDRDERRICGFPTMYTVIDLFDRLGLKYEARVFDYRQAVDYKTDCAVTFAGIGLYQIN